VLTLNWLHCLMGAPWRRFVRYCTVGGINTVVDFSSFAFLTSTLQMNVAGANIISYVAALCASFILNRNFTFRTPTYSLIPAVQFCRFVVVSLVSLIGSTTAIWLLSAVIAPLEAKVVTAPLVVAWGYFAVQRIVFRPPASDRLRRELPVDGPDD
jgi:putative flippase GtrA